MKILSASILFLASTMAVSQTADALLAKAKLNANKEVCEILIRFGPSSWRLRPLPRKVQVISEKESRIFSSSNSYGPLVVSVFSEDFAPSWTTTSKPHSWIPISPERGEYHELGEWMWWEISIPWVTQGSGAYPVYILVLHAPTGAWTFSDLNTLGPDDAGHAGLDFHGGLLLSYTVSFRPKNGDYLERPTQIHFHVIDNLQIKTDKVYLSPIPE